MRNHPSDHAEYAMRCERSQIPEVAGKAADISVSAARQRIGIRLIIVSIALFAMLLPVGQAIGQDALFIDKNGNVGIGTKQPRAKLDVQGAVNAEKVDVQGSVNAAKFTGDGSDLKVANVALRKALDMLLPVGTIMAYGGDVNDTTVKKNLMGQGWLPCDGAEISSDGYRDLFNAIGTAYGGDRAKGRFNVPDLRGRFLRGTDNGTGRDPDAKDRKQSNTGGNSGDRVGSIQEDAFQGHYHETNAINGDASRDAIAGRNRRTPDRHQAFAGKATKDGAFGDPRVSSETRSKNIYVNWIIKANYTFPAAPK